MPGLGELLRRQPPEVVPHLLEARRPRYQGRQPVHQIVPVAVPEQLRHPRRPGKRAAREVRAEVRLIREDARYRSAVVAAESLVVAFQRNEQEPAHRVGIQHVDVRLAVIPVVVAIGRHAKAKGRLASLQALARRETARMNGRAAIILSEGKHPERTGVREGLTDSIGRDLLRHQRYAASLRIPAVHPAAGKPAGPFVFVIEPCVQTRAAGLGDTNIDLAKPVVGEVLRLEADPRMHEEPAVAGGLELSDLPAQLILRKPVVP